MVEDVDATHPSASPVPTPTSTSPQGDVAQIPAAPQSGSEKADRPSGSGPNLGLALGLLPLVGIGAVAFASSLSGLKGAVLVCLTAAALTCGFYLIVSKSVRKPGDWLTLGVLLALIGCVVALVAGLLPDRLPPFSLAAPSTRSPTPTASASLAASPTPPVASSPVPTPSSLAPTSSPAQLAGSNLVGAQLDRQNLAGANLRGSQLMRAHLRGTDLRGACLQGADLSGADLGGTLLWGAALSGAILTGTDLTAARFDPPAPGTAMVAPCR